MPYSSLRCPHPQPIFAVATCTNHNRQRQENILLAFPCGATYIASPHPHPTPKLVSTRWPARAVCCAVSNSHLGLPSKAWRTARVMPSSLRSEMAWCPAERLCTLTARPSSCAVDGRSTREAGVNELNEVNQFKCRGDGGEETGATAPETKKRTPETPLLYIYTYTIYTSLGASNQRRLGTRTPRAWFIALARPPFLPLLLCTYRGCTTLR